MNITSHVVFKVLIKKRPFKKILPALSVKNHVGGPISRIIVNSSRFTEIQYSGLPRILEKTIDKFVSSSGFPAALSFKISPTVVVSYRLRFFNVWLTPWAIWRNSDSQSEWKINWWSRRKRGSWWSSRFLINWTWVNWGLRSARSPNLPYG